MDLIKVIEAFPTQEACVEYLERLRWNGIPECPSCESHNVVKRKETDIGRVGPWNCHNCRATFKVTQWRVMMCIRSEMAKGNVLLQVKQYETLSSGSSKQTNLS